MKRFYLPAIAVLFLVTSVSFSQDKHPIDQEMEQAMDRDPSTAGMVQAMENAQASWDTVLNDEYKKLRAGLDPEAWSALQESQRKWVEWRDLEVASIHAFYAKMQGTMWVPASVSSVMDITRQRALDLKHMADLLDERE